MRYLAEEQITVINRDVVDRLRVKKADSFQVLSHSKLRKIVEEHRRASGDGTDKAAVLFRGLLQEHAFASANRRTAIVSLITFARMNRLGIVFHYEPRVIQGIREGFYSDEEISEWIRGGEMRGFKR